MPEHRFRDRSAALYRRPGEGRQVRRGEEIRRHNQQVREAAVGKLLAFHKAHGKLATVTGINIASRFGELKIDGDSVETFSEKPQDGKGFINGGFFVFSRKILDYLTTDDLCDLEVGPLEQIAAALHLSGRPISGPISPARLAVAFFVASSLGALLYLGVRPGRGAMK